MTQSQLNAIDLVTLVYQRRAVVSGESMAQALAGVRDDLRAAQAWLDGIADRRTIFRRQAQVTAEEADAYAANETARTQSDAVDGWLRTAAGKGHRRESYAEQVDAARAANVPGV